MWEAGPSGASGFSSWRLSSGVWGCSRPGCRGGRGGGRPGRRTPGCSRGNHHWHSGAREPARPDCPPLASASGPLSPEGTVSKASGAPLGLQVEDVGLSVGVAAGEDRALGSLSAEGRHWAGRPLPTSESSLPSRAFPPPPPPSWPRLSSPAGWGLTGVPLPPPGPIHRTRRGVCVVPNRPPFVGTIRHSLRPHPLPKSQSCVPFLLRF